ncbi:hypothetical protein [Teredinibacter turnerae]|uniref:hypothetical protein n=1 Tax=Teredinibacter turnerae TaxID=2426 RepID=UPI00037D09FF|nr:hypothetical protein [Teredinibacter turnerae]
MIDDIQENVGTETAGQGEQIPNDNPEFDLIIADATKTKEQEKREEGERSGSGKISDAQAAQIAAKGLYGLVAIANQFGGYEIEIPDETGQLAISLFCPLVQKYGNKFELDPRGVDLNGWLPEVMALAGAGVVGFTIKNQVGHKGGEGGDKSEHGA